MRARVERVLGALLFVSLLLLALFGGGEGAIELEGSVRDRGPEGRRALLALVTELGLDGRAWNEPPGRLRDELDRHAVLWMARAPRTLGLDEVPPPEADVEESEDAVVLQPEGVPLLGALHDPREYLRFVARGGTLLLPLEESEAFLCEHLGLGAFEGFEIHGDTSEDAWRAHLDGGDDQFELRLRVGDTFEVLDSDGLLRPFLLDDGGHVLAVEHPLDAGRVIVLADDAFASNSALSHGEGDAALFCVRLIESLAEGGQVAFDEYALGRWEPTAATSLATGPAFGLVTWHFLALLLLLVWRAAWSREFPRDPEPIAVLSPLSRARAEARLFLRAARPGRLAGRLRRGVLEQLAGELRVRRQAMGDDEESERAELIRLVGEILARLERLEERGEWASRLVTRPVRTAADLERLERDLQQLRDLVQERRPARPTD